MKRKFSKILGVGLTLALLTSLLLTAAPVLADVSQPTVDLEPDEISPEVGVYTIRFRINEELAPGESITVRFPDDTAVGVDPDVTIEAWLMNGGGLTYGAVTNPTATRDADDEQEVLLEWDIGTITSLGTVKVTFTGGITNPTDPGDYTLEVKTSLEDTYVESESYEIVAPTVGGFVYVYNASNILLATFGGREALGDAANYYGVDDVTIQVGPGTFVLNATTGNIVLSGEGITFESSAGAEDTIIDASKAGTPAIHIQADDVTIDGFTFDGNLTDCIWIKQGTDDVTVENSIFFEGEGSAIVLEAEYDNVNVVTGATIADNVFEDCYSAITILNGATDNTISGNTITGCTDSTTCITLGGGDFTEPTQGNTITDNTITGNAGSGIWLFEWSADGWLVDNVIEGNTISENEGNGIVIASSADVSGLQILNNDILDNEEDGILIESWDATNTIKFNTITGNEDYGIQNDSDADVDAALNWWGTAVADDVGAMVKDTGAGATDYEPFLADTAEAVFSATDVAVEATSLDAEDEIGVKVSGATGANIIAVAKYIANPQGAKGDAIAFWDVYVAGADTDIDVTIKFYAGDENSTLEVWSVDTEIWVDLSEDDTFGFSVYGGYAYIDYAANLLGGTPFVLVAGEPGAEEIETPVLAAPVSGAEDVSLTPTFGWGTVADADGYYFEFADNANFVLPLTKLDGDTGRLIVTAYAYVGELPYSTAYYWRVKAVKGTIEADDLAESDWASAIFITMDEPEPEPPAVWACPQCGLDFATRDALEAHAATAHPLVEPADIIITSPDIIVPLPDVVETPITPGWIYVIIAVGGMLVIAVIVLIVRTRRVA